MPKFLTENSTFDRTAISGMGKVRKSLNPRMRTGPSSEMQKMCEAVDSKTLRRVKVTIRLSLPVRELFPQLRNMIKLL